MKQKLTLIAFSALALVGCGGGGSGSPADDVASNIRSVTADYTLTNPVDLYLGDELVINQQPAGFLTPYKQVAPGARQVVYRDDVTKNVVAESESAPPLSTGGYFTFLTWSSDTGSKVLLLTDDHQTSAGKGKARFVYAASGVGPVDVYLVAPETDLSTTDPSFRNLTPGSATPYVEFDPQWVEFWVTKAGEKDPIFSTSIDLKASNVQSVALVRNDFGNLWMLFLQDLN
ncbi:MAG TPA: DUF4397 domain-containing protein [Fimbriimonas sp.]|nr:DUF4397 domain-containing protein [Fimbriimonas sp.]